MSRPYSQYTGHWTRTEGDGGTPIPASDSSQSTSRRPGHPEFPSRRAQNDFAADRRPTYPLIQERGGPASTVPQAFLPPRHGDYFKSNLLSEMPPPLKRPLSQASVQQMTDDDWEDRQLSRTPMGFQQSFYPSPSRESYMPERDRPGTSGYLSRTFHSDIPTWPETPASNEVWRSHYQSSDDHLNVHGQGSPKRSTITVAGPQGDDRRSKKYRGGRDEFDGSVQYLQKPPKNFLEPQEQDLPPLPVHLDNSEQEDILTQVNRRLSQCAFDFIALYRFPIPIEPNKPAVQVAQDKAWTEWAYLLKRLAIKRKVPSHAIFQGQIKELTTVLDNSLEMRHATKPQPRSLKDDRTVLQFISAGIQVGKMLKDANTMDYLDKLYKQTEIIIQGRKRPGQSYG